VLIYYFIIIIIIIILTNCSDKFHAIVLGNIDPRERMSSGNLVFVCSTTSVGGTGGYRPVELRGVFIIYRWIGLISKDGISGVACTRLPQNGKESCVPPSPHLQSGHLFHRAKSKTVLRGAVRGIVESNIASAPPFSLVSKWQFSLISPPSRTIYGTCFKRNKAFHE
jgi:hypothetical protein